MLITGRLNYDNGVTTYLHYLVKGLSNNNDILLIAASLEASSKFTFPNTVIKVIEELDYNKRNFYFFFKAVLKIFLLVLKFSPDIIHTNNHYTANIAGYSIKILSRKPKMIQTVHSDLSFKGTLKKYFADRYIFVNKHIMDNAIQRNSDLGKCSFLIYNGMKFDKKIYTKQYDHERITITVASRLSQSKGVHNVLISLGMLPDEYKKRVRLVIAGSGEDETLLRSIARRTNIHVKFAGVVSDMQGLFCQTNIFIFSSIVDSFGYTWLEAINFNCFLIISDYDGVEYLLEKDDNFLFYNKNSPFDLQKKIQLAIDMGDVIISKAISLKQEVSRMYFADRMINQTMDVYLL